MNYEEFTSYDLCIDFMKKIPTAIECYTCKLPDKEVEKYLRIIMTDLFYNKKTTNFPSGMGMFYSYNKQIDHWFCDSESWYKTNHYNFVQLQHIIDLYKEQYTIDNMCNKLNNLINKL